MALRSWKFLGSAFVIWAGLASSMPANELSSDEEVIFFDTAVPFDMDSAETTLAIHGWIFEPEKESLARRAALAGIAKMCGFDEQQQASVLFRERAGWFLVDNERKQRLAVKFRYEGPEFALPPSQENGHIYAELKLPTAEIIKNGLENISGRNSIRFELVAPVDRRRCFGRVQLVEPTGWSVVTDIDDTIKDSNVLDKQELLKNAFLREFKAVPGMADTYWPKWSNHAAPIQFHYVSGSPWQLYDPLHTFAWEQKFPQGSWHLRHCRIQDGSIADLLQPPQEYKIAAIDEILRKYPRRNFILVGDTGEKDPEAYGELARRYPNQVRLIALRNVTNESLQGARLQAALDKIAGEKVAIFRQPNELPTLNGIK